MKKGNSEGADLLVVDNVSRVRANCPESVAAGNMPGIKIIQQRKESVYASNSSQAY
jgi:hypothetical protein